MSSLDIKTMGYDYGVKFAENIKPLINNPLSTAVLIVGIILIIVLLAYDKKYGIAKVAFWSTLTVVVVLVLHDYILLKGERETIANKKISNVNIPIPNSLLPSQSPQLPITGRGEDEVHTNRKGKISVRPPILTSSI